jgi:alkylation response protein AidB-like acyl-CoA dehydrogenase
MALMLTEEQEILQHAAHEFVRDRSPLGRVRGLRDGAVADGFSRELWREMARLGWVGMLLPEDVGGAGLGYMDLSVVMEELGRGLVPEPMLSTSLLGANALLLGATPEQRHAHLPAVAAGERLLALAYQEPRSRHDPLHVETRAERDGAGWMLSGEKTHVLDGGAADWFVVSARTGGDVAECHGIGLFFVSADAPGLAVVPHVRVDGRRAAMVRLDGVRVSAGGVIADGNLGGRLLERVLDRATIGLAAEMLGSAGAAFAMTMEYVKTRHQFGVPVGSFQVLKHRAASMFIELELTRSAVMAASQAIDDGRDDAAVSRMASIAKARASDTAILVGNEGIQMHGGIGMTDEHDIGLFLKRARAAEMTFGDAAYHRDRVARLDGY